ncbi:condensation domain-containing protein, partial [Burkholderia stagnalis]
MPAASIEDLYPLSPMQSGMLFHTLTARTGGEYVTQLCVDVAGVDPARLQAAWEAASARHPALRTGFVTSGRGWLQWVARDAAVPFELLDRRTAQDNGAALRELADADIARGFDLAMPPLQRVTLVATGEGRHHLIWTHHHAVVDGWSMAQLLADVLRLYRGDTLPASRGSYRDYVHWLSKRDPQAAQAFWQQRLALLDGPTRIAGAQIGGHAAPRRAMTQTVALDAQATGRIAALAREARVTVNTVVQAAWALLLRSVSGQSPVVFGTVVAGRPTELPDVDAMVGLFINTIPVVARPHGAMTVGAWLHALQSDGVASHEHAYAPLHEIQRQGRAGADGLFDTLLVFENYPVDAVLKDASCGGLAFGKPAARDETNYPLTVTVLLGEQMTLNFTYASDRLDAATVAGYADRLRRAFDALDGALERSVGEIGLLGDEERASLLELSRVDARYDERRPVHRVIQAQAAATPDAVAVEFGDAVLTYRELDVQANRLARRLIALGVG